MPFIIAMTNTAQGCGKTVTAVNLAAAFAIAEKKTLLVNWADHIEKPPFSCPKIASQRDDSGIPLIVCRINDQAELAYLTVNRMKVDLTRLHDLTASFDIVIIDTSSSEKHRRIQALFFADTVIIPVNPRQLDLRHLYSLITEIATIQKNSNPKIIIAGILLTMCSANESVFSQLNAKTFLILKQILFTTVIPYDRHLTRYHEKGDSVILMDVLLKSSQAYLRFFGEVTQKLSL